MREYFESHPAFALLVACADWPCGEERNAKVRNATAKLDGDWDNFWEQVQRHRMPILALDALTQAGIEAPDTIAQLAAHEQRSAMRMIGEADRLIGLLAQSDIAAICLKGPVLSQYLYDTSIMRSSIDLDMLVAWKDFRAAIALLQKEGFVLKGVEPPWDYACLSLWQKGSKDVTLVHPKKKLTIELHHRLKSPDSLLKGLQPDDATQSVNVAGKPFRIFEKRDLFAYLVVHEATSLWHRLKWLADLRALLVTSSEVELLAMRNHSIALGGGKSADLALLLCHQLWDQPVPQEVLDHLKRNRDLQDLLEKSLNMLRGEDKTGPFANTTQVTRAVYQLREDWRFRWDFALASLCHPSLFERWRLPRPLWFVYPLMRLGRWLGARSKSQE